MSDKGTIYFQCFRTYGDIKTYRRCKGAREGSSEIFCSECKKEITEMKTDNALSDAMLNMSINVFGGC